MIMVARQENIRPMTSGTRIWSMNQRTGKPTEEDIASDKVLHTWQPSQPFDALFFLDESVMHEAIRGELLDENMVGTRDMFIADLRRKDSSWNGSIPILKGE